MSLGLGSCYAQDWLWAKSAGGSSNDYCESITTDVNNNVIVTGSFYSSTITFGTYTLTNASTDNSDIFIVKYDLSGNVLWAKSAGGGSSDDGSSITTDANNNVIVTGSFGSSTITFSSDTLTNAGNYDIFVAKLSSEVGISELEAEGESVSLYPNPATSQITIEIASPLAHNDAVISIYDIQGQLIEMLRFAQHDNDRKIEIDISNLPNGLYYLNIHKAEGNVVKKVAVIK
ncbi:MAG: T9SS type A sorting domain-containing protein [Bacteroidia bacterium]|nr:T9SS type A sorting domain-containing protein [Bacteroidia bacterium]